MMGHTCGYRSTNIPEENGTKTSTANKDIKASAAPSAAAGRRRISELGQKELRLTDRVAVSLCLSLALLSPPPATVANRAALLAVRATQTPVARQPDLLAVGLSVVRDGKAH